MREDACADGAITIRRTAGVVVVTMAGELDVDRVGTLRAQLLDDPRPCPRGIVVDLSDVAFRGLAGLRMLAELGRVAGEGGTWLHLAGPSPIVRRVLEITGVGASLPCFGDVEAAIRGPLQQPPG